MPLKERTILLSTIIYSVPSANQEQDFYSNKVGAGFLDYLREHSIYYNTQHSSQEAGNWMETDISSYFHEYMKSRGQAE